MIEWLVNLLPPREHRLALDIMDDDGCPHYTEPEEFMDFAFALKTKRLFPRYEMTIQVSPDA